METILDLINKVTGKACTMETTDGSRRRDTIHHAGYKHIELNGVPVSYPTALYFSESEIDGVDLGVLKLIKTDE